MKKILCGVDSLGTPHPIALNVDGKLITTLVSSGNSGHTALTGDYIIVYGIAPDGQPKPVQVNANGEVVVV